MAAFEAWAMLIIKRNQLFSKAHVYLQDLINQNVDDDFFSCFDKMLFGSLEMCFLKSWLWKFFGVVKPIKRR